MKLLRCVSSIVVTLAMCNNVLLKWEQLLHATCVFIEDIVLNLYWAIFQVATSKPKVVIALSYCNVGSLAELTFSFEQKLVHKHCM